MILSPADLAALDIEIEYKRRVEAGEVHEGPRAMVEYQRRPIDWMVEQLGVPRETLIWSLHEAYETHRWDGDVDPFVQMAEALACYDENGVRAVACESGTTTGKTVFLAFVILWFLACFDNALVVTVAPKEDQLRFHVWKQITAYWPRFQLLFPGAKKDTLRIQMVPGSDVWGAIGFVAGVKADEVNTSATKAQGFHAPHMLIVYEEMAGIHRAIRAAFKNTCRAPHNLQLGVGNPDNQYDALHQMAVAAGTKAVRISALDHPNIVRNDDGFIPGAVSRIGLQMALADVRGDVQHRDYVSRVRGVSPAESADALIKRAWIDDAIKHSAEWQEKYADDRWPNALGADPSNSTAGDPAGLAHFVGPVCVSVEAEPCPNANVFGADVWQLAKDTGTKPEHIGVDPIGVGAGTVNEMRRLMALDPQYAGRSYIPQLESGGKPWNRIAKPGESSGWITDANRFGNLRAQMYWQAAVDFQDGHLGCPNDPQLIEELLAVTYHVRAGKTWMLDKEKIKEILGRSPNKADAFVYGNWVRPRTTPIDHGRLNPDNQALGFKRAGKGVRLVTPQDLARPLKPVTPARGVKKYWGK